MNPAMVLCSHGTADPSGQEVIRRTIAAVRRAARPFDVYGAVVDVETHRLPEVLASIRRPVVVVPLLLSGGYHVRHDIAEAVGAHPSAIAAEPLGPSWTWAQLGVERLIRLGARPDDTLILGASASSEPVARESTVRAASMVAELWGSAVDVGYVGHTGPSVEDLVARARVHGSRIVVSSYLLAPGHFQRRLHECGADLVTPPLLSASPRRDVVDLIMRRFDRAARRLPWGTPLAFDHGASGRDR